MNNVLLCTVGGSHQPILTAITELRPVHVLFFCTGKDAATGRPGSIEMVTGKGKPVTVRRGPDTEQLPNLPTLAGLSAEQFTTCLVPPDALDDCAARMLEAVATVQRQFPAARLVADYTGGTKTMTAALVMVALEQDGIELQLVTGARADLIKVHDGSQAGVAVSAEGIRLRRAMAPFLAAWDRFAYGEAADGLMALRPPRLAPLQADLQIARDLSRAFDAWDRFDHAAALRDLEIYRARLGQADGALTARLFTALKALTSSNQQHLPACLWDLWLNAQRRARQGRYDDAVARGYRLLEWTAQWLLAGVGIDTGNVLAEQVPASTQLPVDSDGRRRAGLLQAWTLAAHHLGGAVQQFMDAEGKRLLNQLQTRNASILAHGETPIARADWQGFAAWLERALLPLFKDQAERRGVKQWAPQLPCSAFWQPH